MIDNNSLIRIIIFVVLFCFLNLLPWWLVSVFLLAVVMYYDQYYELLFFGVWLDALYAVPDRFSISGHSFLLASAAVLIIVFFIKKRLLWYSR